MTISRRNFLAGAASLGLAAGLPPGARGAKTELPFPELTAAGSHGAIGEKIGRTFARQIAHNVGFYLDWLSGAKRSEHARILKIAGSFAPVLKEYLPGQLEEMDGMARAAKRTLSEILVINARTDLGVLTRPRNKAGAEPEIEIVDHHIAGLGSVESQELMLDVVTRWVESVPTRQPETRGDEGGLRVD